MVKMEEFCRENDLNSKSMKEAHFLCIQLQRIASEDLFESDPKMKENFDFTVTSDFKQPSRQEEEVLQQVLISGLSENLCRVAPIFDSMGNEIVLKGT